jgi:hypothetical protein
MTDKPDGNGRLWGRLSWYALLFPLVCYAVAYYALVVPYPRSHIGGIGPWHSYQVAGRRLPEDAHVFFASIHWLDRKVRPATWWLREEFPPIPLVIEGPSP